MKVTTYRMARTKHSRSKYGNRKCRMDGFSFDSVKEMNRYADLKFLCMAGEIKDLELQKPFELQPGFRDRDGKWIRPIYYIADFVYKDAKTGEQHIEDVKGYETDAYKLKRKMMAYNGLYIEEIK